MNRRRLAGVDAVGGWFGSESWGGKLGIVRLFTERRTDQQLEIWRKGEKVEEEVLYYYY